MLPFNESHPCPGTLGAVNCTDAEQMETIDGHVAILTHIQTYAFEDVTPEQWEAFQRVGASVVELETFYKMSLMAAMPGVDTQDFHNLVSTIKTAYESE